MATGFWTTRRARLVFDRVNVRFGDDGVVVEADAG
jgi:hypothetical protein